MGECCKPFRRPFCYFKTNEYSRRDYYTTCRFCNFIMYVDGDLCVL